MHPSYRISKGDAENVPPEPTAATIAPNVHAPQTMRTLDVKIEEIPPNQFYREALQIG